jgi:hypothetical protein
MPRRMCWQTVIVSAVRERPSRSLTTFRKEILRIQQVRGVRRGFSCGRTEWLNREPLLHLSSTGWNGMTRQ